VLVVVIAVDRMPVPVVHVVDVVLVRHRDMTAVRPMLVGVSLVRHVLGQRALIDVVVVDAVNMPVVHVVGVTLVRYRDVTAPIAVSVFMITMSDVLSVWHGIVLHGMD
jgi:hypothetical protein